MSVQFLSVNLVASFKNGDNVPFETFLGKLMPSQESPYKYKKSKGAWESALIVLAEEELKNYASDDEPSESFFAAINSKFNDAANWLSNIENRLFEEFREIGLSLSLIIDSWIDQDQFELKIPPKFLAECGNKGIELYVITND